MSRNDMGLLEYLAWLERQEAELVEKLEEVRVAKKHARRAAEEMEGADLPSPVVPPTEEKPAADGARPGQFSSMKPRKAARVYLRQRGKPATTVQIRKALEAGNVNTEAEKFHQTLYNTLQRMKRKDGTVVNYGGGLWGLPEWPEPSEEEKERLLN